MRAIRNVSLVVAGILIFASLIHRPWPVRIIALLALSGSALVIGSATRENSLMSALGLERVNRRTLLLSICALLLGAGLAMLTRNKYELTLLPASLSYAALISPLVGVTEELVFRGFIQGHLRPIGRAFPVVYAATVHTCYKLLVILTLSASLQFDLFFLVVWTFLGGLLFGLLRHLANSVVPPAVAHAIFDIVVYGSAVTLPVWVWS